MPDKTSGYVADTLQKSKKLADKLNAHLIDKSRFNVFQISRKLVINSNRG
jgi:hypothetical protein